MDTGSSSVLSAGPSSFSSGEKKFILLLLLLLRHIFRAGKKLFFILNTLSTISKQYMVGGVPSFL